LLWTAGIAWAAWTDFASNPVLTLVVAATSVYLLTAGIVQQVLPGADRRGS
jgi:phosphatidylcholine synthase